MKRHKLPKQCKSQPVARNRLHVHVFDMDDLPFKDNILDKNEEKCTECLTDRDNVMTKFSFWKHLRVLRENMIIELDNPLKELGFMWVVTTLGTWIVTGQAASRTTWHYLTVGDLAILRLSNITLPHPMPISGDTLCCDNCQLIGMPYFHSRSAGKNNRN